MKLAVMLKDLGSSQLSYSFISKANEILADRCDLDVVALYEVLTRPCIPLYFSCMQAAEGWGMEWPIVATTFSTAEKLIRFPSATKKGFLVWDLEWLRMDKKSFRPLQAVYGNQQLILMARSRDHARAIEDCWNRKVEVVEEFDLHRIYEVVTGETLAV